jgi:CRISPR-associated protein Cas2
VRTRFIVSYDIADPARLRRVYATMRGYGEWVQFSIFSCELNEREEVVLRALLAKEINETDDQVLFVDLGPADGRGGTAIRSLGRPLSPRKRVLVL